VFFLDIDLLMGAILLDMAGVQIAHANRTFFSFSECYISASNIGSVSDEVASPAIRTVRSNSDFYRLV